MSYRRQCMQRASSFSLSSLLVNDRSYFPTLAVVQTKRFVNFDGIACS